VTPDGGTVLAAALLVLLHRADGGVVQVAAGQITSLHAAVRSGIKVVNPGARCVIWLADGRVLSVVEPCEEVRRLLDEAVAPR
jgi:hypothetical protein